MFINKQLIVVKNKLFPSFSSASRELNLKTIFALSSGRGKCGVAVIRVSGPHSGQALKLMTGLNTLPKPREAILKSIKYPNSKEIIDKGLVMWFPAPRSFTGEDCCEFQVHGGVAVVSAILGALGSIDNLRLAKAGEFTRRAFYNGKLDLTEVEGLADLLQAETEVQRKQAFLQTQGSLSKLYNKWREMLIRSVAHIEALIDFDETETIDLNIMDEVKLTIIDLKKQITDHLEDGRKGERLRNGVRTVILGEPNVGKSSLFNSLCQRPAAIVTPMEGTTRDILEVTIDVKGYPLLLTDTAGLRHETVDVIEKEGINRALKTYQESDLIILLIDISKYLHLIKQKGISEFVKLYVSNLHLNNLLNENTENLKSMFTKRCIVVCNKIDLIKNPALIEDLKKSGVICLSCKTESGFDGLVSALTDDLKILCGEPTEEHPSMNQMRHRQNLVECAQHLTNFLEQTSKTNYDSALVCEDLRKALRSLGKLTGNVTAEQLLDVIFKDFCIGK